MKRRTFITLLGGAAAWPLPARAAAGADDDWSAHKRVNARNIKVVMGTSDA